MAFDEWGPTEAAAAGWGPEEEAEFQAIVNTQDKAARDLLMGNGPPGTKPHGEEMRQQIRQVILAKNAGKKTQEMETAFEYGGRKGKAQEDAEYFRRKAEESQNRPGVQVDYGRANEWDAAAARQSTNSLQARGQQVSMADLMARRARGEVPSIAGMRADLDIGRGMADQSSIAASARGPAAMALASQQAGANSAALSQRISNDAQVNTAKERLDAEQAALAGYSGIRQGDQQGQAADLAGAQAAAGRAMGQASLDDSQRARNDAREANMYGNEIGVNTTQMQGQGNKMAVKMGQQQAAIAAQERQQARADSNIMGGLQAGSSLLATLPLFFGSDERAKVPVTWGTPESYDQHRASAEQALAAQDMPKGGPGPMAVAGIDALRRRDEEDAGLARAKQRHGIDLDDKEERRARSAERRLGIEEKAKRSPEEPKGEKKASFADRFGMAMGGIGQALGRSAASARDRATPPPVYLPQMQPITGSYRTPSGMEWKEPAQPPGNAADAMQPAPRGPLASQAFGRLNGINAALDMGPSVQGAMTRPMQIQYPSDDRTKLAAAWEQGHAAAIADVEKAGRADPAETKRRSEGDEYHPAYAAARGIKARAWDEGNKEGDVAARMKANREKLESQAPGQAAAQDARVAGMVGKGKFPTVPTEDAAEANRALASSAYTYKPEFAAQAGQPPGEVNVGPMTQRMEQSEIARTAVKKDEEGRGAIDIPKFTKVLATGLSGAQQQIDEQEERLRTLAQMLRRRAAAR